MPTGSDFALITDKKLLGVRDFDLWILKYLTDYIGQSVKRLFIQGSFEERMPLSSPGAGQIEVGLKPTELDGFAHDGAGHILDLEQIDRVADFPNVSGQTYEVGAAYITYPFEIRTNPHTGRFEYDRMREGIGAQATPDAVQVDTSTLTFTVDSLFEQDVAVGDHSGRQVRVFLIIPGDVATSEAIAIETCTVFYDGQNKVTTTGLLGQSVGNGNQTFYIAQLVGLTVLADTATNAPSQLPESVFFIGTVEGNDATPVAFDITGQKVIQAQSADLITVDPLGNWADGTTNPGGFLQAVLEKIVSDLTSTSGEYGAGKLTAADRSDWFDGTTNPAATLATALSKIVSDLADITGDGNFSGAQKVSAIGLGPWADGTLNEFGSVQDLLANIVDALTSTTDPRGAGKITAPALPDWADGTTNPAARVDEALAKIVTDLTSLVDAGGTGKIAGIGFDSEPYALAPGLLLFQLGGIVGNLNETAVHNERRSEFEAIQGLRLLYTDVGGGTMRDIAARFQGDNPNDNIVQLVAVGDGTTIARQTPGQAWQSVTPAAGFNLGFRGVCYGANGFALVGGGGEIQLYTGSIARQKTGGNGLNDVAYMGNTYCAVGDGGHIWTSTNGTSWTQRTGAPGTTSDNYHAIETDGSQFVVLVSPPVVGTSSCKVMTSPDGINWTAQPSGQIAGWYWLKNQLQYSPQHGFAALRITNSDIAVSHSDDGVNWINQVGATPVVVDEASMVIALLDRQIAYFHSSISPGNLNAIVAEEMNQSPATDVSGFQQIFNIADCFATVAKNIKGTLYVVGRAPTGDAIVMSGPPMRPNSRFGV